jgi:hypothetical protein
MPKDSTNGDVEETYAERLNFHLKEHGTRPDGHPDFPGKLWEYDEFAKTAGVDSRSLRNYRSSVIPKSSFQNRIEHALFGDNEAAYGAWRKRLRDAATRTERTNAEPALLAHWTILPSEFTDGLAEVRLHQPRPGNMPNQFYIEATLRLQKGEYDYEDRTVSIGLKDAFLLLESPNYQATKGSMIGEREHPNFEADVGGAKIKGPRSDGCLAGNPLGDEYVAVIEPVGSGKEEPAGGGKEVVTVSLHAGRRSAFDVALIDDQDERTETYPTINKRAVLDAVINEGLGRDRQGRVILARSKIQRKPRT